MKLKTSPLIFALLALFVLPTVSRAETIYDNPTIGGYYAFSSAPVIPFADGVIKHVQIEINPSASSALNGQYLVMSIWCFNNSSCAGASSLVFNNETGDPTQQWSDPILYTGQSQLDFYFDSDLNEILDYTQFSTARSLVLSARHFDSPPTDSTDWGNANGYVCQYGNCAYDGTTTSFTNFGSVGNITTLIDGTEPTPPYEYSTLISINEPTEGETVATTSVSWEFEYFNGGIDPQNHYRLSFCNTTIFNCQSTATSTLALGTNTYSGSITLTEGGYEMVLWTYELADENISPATSWSSKVRRFTVIASNSQDIVGIDLNNPYSVLDNLGFSTTTCGVTSGEKLQACAIQAGLALFWPSASSTEAILSIKDLVVKKPPIGYFTAVTGQLEQIGTTSTSTVILPVMPQGLKDLVFTPVNAAIAAIIWWFFGVHFWHRLRDLDII